MILISYRRPLRFQEESVRGGRRNSRFLAVCRKMSPFEQVRNCVDIRPKPWDLTDLEFEVSVHPVKRRALGAFCRWDQEKVGTLKPSETGVFLSKLLVLCTLITGSEFPNQIAD